MVEAEIAKRALALLDLTNLDDTCDAGAISDLTKRARTPHGAVAAVCVWPRFVAQAARELAQTPTKIATVVNFPTGSEPVSDVIAMTEAALEDGADEIDMVIPWAALLEGHPENVSARVARVKQAAGPNVVVKAIIESGMLGGPDMIRAAAQGAIDGGADFVKTSTGKVPLNATPEAAEVILGLISQTERPIGFKASGGIRTAKDTAIYLALADAAMGPDWATPQTFRFGASSVLTALLAAIEGRSGDNASSGY